MAKRLAYLDRPWTATEVETLKTEIKQSMPLRLIGLKLHRSPEAVHAKANDLRLSKKPRRLSPSGRTKSIAKR
jgi:hypothetical protein